MYAVIVTVLLFVAVLAGLVMFGMSLAGTGAGAGFHASRMQFQEETIGGDHHTDNKIAVIHLSGVISAAEDGLPVDDGLVGYIEAQLQQALDDDDVKAIIIRINSPGGEVVASDLIYRAIRAADDEKPVVACMDSVGASGGYYAAVGARHIVANEMTITGSIGVIMQTFTATELADKVGLKFHTFKSGRYKDLLNPTREPTPDELALVNNLVMEIYEKFVGIVALEREMDLADLKNGLADGRILSGRQALDGGFIDELGYFEDAVATAKEYAGIAEARTVRYLLPFSLRNLFRFLGETDSAKVKIELSPAPLTLQAGQFYFLPAYLFQ